MGIDRREAGGVLELVLDRPDKKNALTAAMYRALIDGLAEAARRPEIVAVLLAGNGDAFCAGNDVADFMAPGGVDAAFEFVHAIAGFGKPLVAAVHGLAIGIGTTMLLHCDLIYAATDTRFIVPFAKLGLVPEAGCSLLLPRTIGHAKAAAMLLLGEPLDAAAADRAGLVTAVVDGDVRDHARARAAALAAVPPNALAATRGLLRGDRAAVDACIAEEIRLFGKALGSDEANAAASAFFRRR